MYKVKAPFNGTIDEVFGKVGESGMPGMPVVRIINYAKTKIVADISDTYYSKVKVGDPVEVSFPDLEQKFTSRVKSKGQVINNVNRTFTVEIEAGSMSGTIRPNMIAEVFINDYTANMAKVVPLNFVQTDLKGDFVFTVGEEKGKSVAKRSLIEKGLYYGDSVEIKNGLNFDDQVISTGYLNVTEGQILNIK
jgi:RND family efflux transporter MFP subunit